MQTDGMVSMSLAQVDKLRDTITAKELEVAALKANIEQIKAEKRVIIRRKGIKWRIGQLGFGYDPISSLVNKLLDGKKKLQSYGRGTPSMFATHHSDYGMEYDRPEAAIIKDAFYSHVTLETVSEPDEYLNFDDVKIQLIEEAEQAVNVELGKLRQQVATLEQARGQLIEEYTQKGREVEKAFAAKEKDFIEHFEKYKENSDKVIADLRKQYDDLKFDRDTRSTEQKLRDEIKQLKEDLYKATHPWWAFWK